MKSNGPIGSSAGSASTTSRGGATGTDGVGSGSAPGETSIVGLESVGDSNSKEGGRCRVAVGGEEARGILRADAMDEKEKDAEEV